MSQDTGKRRTNLKDQYYTKSEVAKECVNLLLHLCPETSEYLWIEPSAGSGVFLKQVPSKIQTLGLDIDPKDSQIQRANFLAWNPPSDKEIVVFGNPPFGRQASLAKAFLKHACEFAHIVAFILPRSFLKPSMTNSIPLAFHCVSQQELPPSSFEVNQKDYDVPCIFQIWKRMSQPRTLQLQVEPAGFTYVKNSDTHHLIVRRVGVSAGKANLPGTGTYNSQTHYFLRLDEKYRNKNSNIVQKLNNYTFPTNTTGPRSLSKSEVSEVLNQIVYSESS